jgi:hypothetical protein
MEISSAWTKVLLIYENKNLKAAGMFKSSKEFFTLERVAADEIGELFGTNPQNLKYEKGSDNE